ncbi:MULTISPECIES: response regulator [unclassified Mesorhizobium]|uniref:response regulator n=1 Tax=unclassified Mesorhizobium TaxID=325217 RepID=UPI003339079A
MTASRILIVEDEWLVAEEHRAILEEAGFAIAGPVPSVARAKKLIEGEVISAAVLDIGLGGETSAALVPLLAHRGIPFVFVSGYTASDIPQDLRHHKMLSKPVWAAALVEAVRNMLGVQPTSLARHQDSGTVPTQREAR